MIYFLFILQTYLLSLHLLPHTSYYLSIDMEGLGIFNKTLSVFWPNLLTEYQIWFTFPQTHVQQIVIREVEERREAADMLFSLTLWQKLDDKGKYCKIRNMSGGKRKSQDKIYFLVSFLQVGFRGEHRHRDVARLPGGMYLRT